MKRVFGMLPLLIMLVAGCGGQVSRNQLELPVEGPRILAMGDSMLAWHSTTERSITHVVANELGEPVVNRAVSGARIIYKLPLTGSMGMRISSQYLAGDWDWIIVNGGGNDLWLGCRCSRCAHRMGKMISYDGRRGEIPRLLWTLRQTGAQVVYVGYLRSPGRGSIIEHCRDEGDELERRVGKLAEILDGVYFLSVADMVPHGDRSYHALDMIHPSLKASEKIGQSIADLIRETALGDPRVRK